MNRVATIALLAFAFLFPTSLRAQVGAEAAAGHTIALPDEIAFAALEVPGFDPGVELAVLHGDPMATSGTYTVRLRFPDGYRFPSHYHPKAENVTVVSGTFRLGMGTSEDPASMQTYAPGTFLHIPAESPHYGGVEGQTVIQLHGEGPFEIVLANQGA